MTTLLQKILVHVVCLAWGGALGAFLGRMAFDNHWVVGMLLGMACAPIGMFLFRNLDKEVDQEIENERRGRRARW